MCYNFYGGSMKNIARRVYFIPEGNSTGGNFFHEFAGFGENLPDSLEGFIPENMPIKEIAKYLQEILGYNIVYTGGPIHKSENGLEPYIAYENSNTSVIDKEAIVGESLRLVKKHYTYVSEELKKTL